MVAFVIAFGAAVLHYFRAAAHGGLSDFSQLWYGARMIMHHLDPYELIGPGRQVELHGPVFYPATAFVAAIPFTLLRFHAASTLFVFLSAFLLAYGATVDGWHRLPIFPSIAFFNSAQLGQSSIILATIVFLPWLGLIAGVKPQASIPAIASATNRTVVLTSIAGAVLLVVVSLLLLPSWPVSWWEQLQTTRNFVPPIARPGGLLILVVLLRWKRPETWLIVSAACLPQTWLPYNGLILLLVAITYREAALLSLVSSAVWLLASQWVGHGGEGHTQAVMSTALIAGGFLPAVVMVLFRPNRGPVPYWLRCLGAPPVEHQL